MRRQTLLVVHGNSIKSRLISSREAARLMGLPDDYKLPEKYNEAYHLLGGCVGVPVVTPLRRHFLLPIAELNHSSNQQTMRRARRA